MRTSRGPAAASRRPCGRRARRARTSSSRWAARASRRWPAEGVTTVEIKSGYGLATEAECRQLRAARRLAAEVGVDLRTTLLAAHAVPVEFDGRADDYIDLVCRETIPAAAGQGIADAVDAFCETIGFSDAQTRRVFAAARAHGLPVKLHADQLSDAGGAALAAEFGALSADHLEYTSDAGVAAMARAGTVAVLLPGAFHLLRETQLPPIAAMREQGVPMAVATDCNPGTSPSTSLPLMLNMACTLFRLTPEEALTGVTRHAARALGLPRSRHARRGTARRPRALGYRGARGALLLDGRQSLPGNGARGRSLGTFGFALRSPWAARRAHATGGRMTLCEIARGDSPLIVDVPHAGTFVPPAIAARLTPAARSVPDTDWHVEKLFAFARDAGATLVAATHSRYVVDLNRDPSGAALYPGADNTELCPTRTFADEPIYAAGEAPDATEVAARRAEYFEPYHAQLAAEIERVRSRHGYAIVLDGHSIRSQRAALLRGTPARPQSGNGRRRELRARTCRAAPRSCSPAPLAFPAS